MEDLSLRKRPLTGPTEAFRNDDARPLEEAQHPPARIVDGHDRRGRQPGPALSPHLGIARRTRNQVEQIRRRPGMDREARRERARRADRRLDYEHVPTADGVFRSGMTRTSGA